MIRSRAHTLKVAAARIEQEHGNAKLVADLKAAAMVEASRVAESRDHHQDEDQRIGRQRTVMAMVPDTRAKDDLLSRMTQRAYDLMWAGDCAGCDALIEFLPSALVEKMFSAWEKDGEGKEPRSPFYSGEFRA